MSRESAAVTPIVVALTSGAGLRAPLASSLHWGARHVAISNKFTLNIPVMAFVPAVVRVSFSTAVGDICFGVKFKSNTETTGLVLYNIVLDSKRYQSHLETYHCELRIDDFGVLSLEWENRGMFWRQDRLLTYDVHLQRLTHLSAPVKTRKIRERLCTLSSEYAQHALRTRKLEEFVKRCDSTSNDLQTRINELQSELSKVVESRCTAQALITRANEQKVLAQSNTIMEILSFVANEEWLEEPDRESIRTVIAQQQGEVGENSVEEGTVTGNHSSYSSPAG